jgi:hypothetical protein
MHDELNFQDDPQNRRYARTPKPRGPRASRSTRFQKKAASFNGTHRRRNKHWSW